MSKKPSFVFEQSQDNQNRTWVYKLKGKLVGTPECYSFLEDARDKITTDTPNVALDMTGVTLTNSTGVGMIASLMTASKETKGRLFLVKAPDNARRQLEVTRVWEFLTPLNDLNELPANLNQ